MSGPAPVFLMLLLISGEIHSGGASHFETPRMGVTLALISDKVR